MFCPLKGRGVSPLRRSTLQSAAVINDFPAPLEVPNTMRAGCAVIDAADAGAASDASLEEHLQWGFRHPNHRAGLVPSE